jgi:hypothetical protein
MGWEAGKPESWEATELKVQSSKAESSTAINKLLNREISLC